MRFPHVIDNSTRKELAKCQMIAHWKYEMGLNAPGAKVDLHAGAAFATGMEAMRQAFYIDGYYVSAAVEKGVMALYEAYGDFKCPEKSNKSADRMAGALTYYASRRPLDEDELKPIVLDGRKGVEIAFEFPIGIDHPVTEKELTYCGRFDMLAEDKNGGVWVVDEKTTSKMGDAWVHQWDLDSQMTGYCWGAKELLKQHGIEKEVKGAVINGISILKYEYDHMRCPTFRQDWEVDRWFKQMRKDVHGWIEAFKRQDHNQVLDHACALYNAPCAYAKLCKSANPERIIDGNYVVQWWNPLTREIET